MDIKFLNNGFEFKNDFIAYQAISEISSVTVQTVYNNYDVLSRQFCGDNISKYCSFMIKLRNGHNYEIYLDTSIKQFRRIANDIVGWKYLKMLLTGKLSEGIDDKAREWLKNKPLDMYESIAELMDLRTELITHFDNWKGN